MAVSYVRAATHCLHERMANGEDGPPARVWGAWALLCDAEPHVGWTQDGFTTRHEALRARDAHDAEHHTEGGKW